MVLPDSHEVPRASQYSGTGTVTFPTRFHVPRSTQVPAPSLWLSNTGLSPSLAELSSSLLLTTRESDLPALQPQMNESIWFGLFPVRSPLLGESRLISFPSGTEMFHFPEFAPCNLCIQLQVTGYDSRRVSPFRDPRIKGCLAPPRGLSQLTTSFIAFRRQGIHPMLLSTCLLEKNFLPIPMQLSISHPFQGHQASAWFELAMPCASSQAAWSVSGGGRRNRTDDLLRAKQTLSQLSYTPTGSSSG